MSVGRSLIVLVLLAGATLVAGPATAQLESPFIVLGIERQGELVKYRVQANRPDNEVTVSLTEGGVLLGLPERRFPWNQSEIKTLPFTLLREADRATLVFRWEDNLQELSQSIGVPVPKRGDSSAGDDAAPRLAVAAAVRDARTLNVTIENYGTAVSEPLVLSLEDAQGRKFGAPYYRRLDPIGVGATRVSAFTVPATLESVVVVVEHDGRTERTAVAVHAVAAPASSAPPANVTLATDLPFREADIGRTVDYAVRVQNSGRLALVSLAAEGLPAGYSARFFVGGSAVPSLFVDRNVTRQATLSVTIPNAESEVDRTVDFRIVARVNGTPMASLPAGLAVRGVGKLEVSGDLDLSDVPPGGSASFTATVRNSGTAPLFDVEVEARRPYGWTFRFDPRRIDRLDPGESVSVTVEVRAPEVVGAGRYVADLTAKSGDVASRAATVSMEVAQVETGGGWIGWALLATMGAILGGAWYWKRKRGVP